SGSAATSLSIPYGEGYDIVIRGYDRYGVQTHQGTAWLASIAVGDNKPMLAELSPVRDGYDYAKIQVGLVGETRMSGGRIVIKAPSNVNQGASATLVASVVDANGALVEVKPGELHWSINDPR